MSARSLGDRLRLLREARGLNQKEMSAALDLGESSWQRWELKDRLPSAEVLERLAAEGVSIDWLISGRGEMMPGAGPTTIQGAAREALIAMPTLAKAAGAPADQIAGLPELGNFVLVPRYDLSASAGPGAFADQERVVDHLAFSREWVRRVLGVDPRQLVLITAIGDSMLPTIQAGDLLLVDRSVQEFRDDAIYVVSIEGHLMVKRIQRFFGGAVVVKSDNKAAYVEQTLAPAEAAQVFVAGRLRWIGRMI